MLFRVELYFRMSCVNSDLSEKFPAEGGKEPGFDPFGLSDLFVVFRQDKERLLRKVGGLALIFCQAQTKPVKTGIIFRNDRLQVYLLSHYERNAIGLVLQLSSFARSPLIGRGK